MRLLRTIRMDPSDTFVFDRAAEPGEWAVPGLFMFARRDATGLTGKVRAAFRAGFLGLGSSGWSTLVQVAEAGGRDRAAAVKALSRLLTRFGAPDAATAQRAAAEEIDFAESLCNHPAGVLVAVSRRHDCGTTREVFRTITPRPPSSVVPFTFVEMTKDEERLDLLRLAEQRQ